MKYKKGFKQPFLLSSDVHYDNPKCDRDLYHKHLDQAKERGAGVFCFGDFFCLMQSRKDRRGSKSDIRPEHNGSNYFDLVINEAAKKMAPYSQNIILFSDGNHETAVVKNMETNPLERLVAILNHQYNGQTLHGYYQGFVRFRFEHESGGRVKTITLAYHHGKWGGVVTKGVPSVARFSAMFPQADIIVSGHTHDAWNVVHTQTCFKENGEVYNKEQEHIKTPTYKEEFLKGSGFATEKIVQPKPLGGYWLNFYYESQEIKFDIVRAKK